MRMLFGVLFLSTLINIAPGQECSPNLSGSDANVRVQRLTIESSTLPNGDRERIARSLEHCSWSLLELEERIRQALRDLGYFKANADEPRVSFVKQGTRDADVSIKVQEGPQYRLGDIRFEKASLFPPDRLREQFAILPGDLFNATKFGQGLEQLRNLYATEGHVNFVGVPVVAIDESRRTIDLTIDVDEGKPYNFGRLLLDGSEPRAGSGKALMESWSSLEGKRYNPLALKQWLEANSSAWPGIASAKRDLIQSQQSLAVDVHLSLP